MASTKAEKSSCCSQDGQSKKEPVKASCFPLGSKAAPAKKVEQKPQEPKKKVSGTKPATPSKKI